MLAFTHMFFQLVQGVFVLIGSADVSRDGCLQEDAGVGVIGWWSGSGRNRVLRVAAAVVPPALTHLSPAGWLPGSGYSIAFKYGLLVVLHL